MTVQVKILECDVGFGDEDVAKLKEIGERNVQISLDVQDVEDTLLFTFFKDGGIGVMSYKHGTFFEGPWNQEVIAIKSALGLKTNAWQNNPKLVEAKVICEMFESIT